MQTMYIAPRKLGKGSSRKTFACLPALPGGKPRATNSAVRRGLQAALCPEIRDTSPQAGVLVHYTFEDEYLQDAVRKWAQGSNGYSDLYSSATRQVMPALHI